MRHHIMCATLVGLSLLFVSPSVAQSPVVPGVGPLLPALLLQNGAVQRDLRLDPEQTRQLQSIIRAVRHKYEEQVRQLQGLEPAQRRGKMPTIAATITQALDKELSGVLRPEQAQRFRQLVRQQQGIFLLQEP